MSQNRLHVCGTRSSWRARAPAPTRLASKGARPRRPARAHPRLSLARRAPARRDALPLAASNAAADDDDDAGVDAVLSEGQLAGAASADAGAPGGACDIARALQGALRRDPLVRSAVAAYAGKAIMVWNGDWVRSRGEDGKGLAAVREAILWEVAFAPKACRAEPMHGLVVISLNQAQGTTRLAVGQGEWRWSDLLAPRAAAR
ncbi:MAG: hypothetical protein P4L73_19045 [Caulobacteraceae bacterium]|nr:hypothetical protein [Caulobacteraceae bacterium]